MFGSKSVIFLAIVCLKTTFACAQTNSENGEKVAKEDPVSFVKDVAPIIVAKCGKCHVSNSRGKYQIESYHALMDSDSIDLDDPNDSHFIEVIESGEMPKGGLTVSNSELATLKTWVAQGAKYDGDNEKAALAKSESGSGRLSGGNRRGRAGGNSGGGSRLRAVEKNPQAVGEQGVAWYTTWETARAEASRSNRPIFFMSAAAQCSGVSGVF